MKKLTIVLSLALVLAFSVGAFAALNTNITGWVDTDITYKKANPNDPDAPYYLEARGRARIQMNLSASGSGNPRVTVNMSNAANETGWTLYTSSLSRNTNVPFNITGWNLVATGAYWKDGPSLTTTIGSVNRNWNAYTAWSLGPNIIEIAGGKVGPFTIDGLYAYTGGANNTAALKASGTINPITVNAFVTNYGPQTSTTRDNQFTIDAKFSPVADVDLSGVFSYDGKNEGISYKAETTVKTIPNLTLTGLVRATDANYSPAHTDTRANNRVWWPNEKLYKVTAATTQAGISLSGSYAYDTNYAGQNGRSVIEGKASTKIENFNVGGTVTLTNHANNTSTTKTVLDASTNLSGVSLTYKGTIETNKEMINELGANTKRDLFFADGVTLDAKVIFDENQAQDRHKLRYGADASWRLPNGLDVWVGYANYNKSGNAWVNGTGDDGFYVRAYRRITF